MRAGLTVRAAGVGDAATIVDLIESAYRGERSRAGWTTEADLLGGQRTDLAMVTAELGRPDIRFLVAVAPAPAPAPDAGDPGGMVVGCCQLQQRADGISYFGMFAVRPELQGRGIGDALLAAAERFACLEWSSARMEMFVISLRAELIAWYERRGYRRTERCEPFPYGDERFGVPRRADLAFVVLDRDLRGLADRLGAEAWPRNAGDADAPDKGVADVDPGNIGLGKRQQSSSE
ncbi:GNAT family N-acetyltransferase [Parafrankia elaeagni]|uniref:GNAT family N-acetyltransferase n=1 Tax=Parafrankia elaeagni TaxID=222534 RepID=UPI00037D363A|nr:GNAT family N-acetyltransferase [Parafrankia elaeagni]